MKHLKRNYEWKLRTIGNSIFLSNSVRVFKINVVTAKLVQLADGTRNKTEIVDRAILEFDPDSLPASASADLTETIDALTRAGIIRELL